jgi:hypothetical protein
MMLLWGDTIGVLEESNHQTDEVLNTKQWL